LAIDVPTEPPNQQSPNQSPFTNPSIRNQSAISNQRISNFYSRLNVAVYIVLDQFVDPGTRNSGKFPSIALSIGYVPCLSLGDRGPRKTTMKQFGSFTAPVTRALGTSSTLIRRKLISLPDVRAIIDSPRQFSNRSLRSQLPSSADGGGGFWAWAISAHSPLTVISDALAHIPSLIA
jgi:hypothetical protein